MTMNVSLRNRPSTDSTATGNVAQPQPTATPAIQQSTGRRGADVVEGQAPSDAARRFERISSPTVSVCRERLTDAQLASRFREIIARGETPRMTPPPPLPRASGAELAQQLRTARPQLSASYTRALNAEASPGLGVLMPMALHKFAEIFGRHPDPSEMGAVELIAHGAAEAAAHHGVEVAATSLGAAGSALVTPLLLLDSLILSVLQMAYRLNNGTLPPAHTVQHMMREEAPQLLAAAQHRVEQQLERQFASGADAGAHGQPPPANSSPAFRRGYDAGLQYRQAHGCELEEYEQQRRILDAVTRGTSRDPSVGIRALVVGPERPSGIVSEESLANIVRGE